ncbi:hypothetical protein L0337_20880 [candidate division KSB1 bacterium]|nr:hypothetical protein [candidate division KSB1 bacterium]
MRLSYDPEVDLLEVIFDERLHGVENEKAAFQLRDGIILYVTADLKRMIQLTVVNYRRYAELPVVHFEGWNTFSKKDKQQLLPLIASPTLLAFLKLDPKTGYGHLTTPDVLEMFAVAA